MIQIAFRDAQDYINVLKIRNLKRSYSPIMLTLRIRRRRRWSLAGSRLIMSMESWRSLGLAICYDAGKAGHATAASDTIHLYLHSLNDRLMRECRSEELRSQRHGPSMRVMAGTGDLSYSPSTTCLNLIYIHAVFIFAHLLSCLKLSFGPYLYT